jgi:His/Glu/Gln/Arg/opine family amino acid ABC transporter permease subunit
MMIVTKYIPLLLQGFAVTVASWLCAGVASLLVGMMIGIVSCNYLTKPWISWLVRLYVFIAKGVPPYVQILIAYFVLPSALGINLSGFSAATGALAFCSSGYITEIIRSGINAIPQGQWDACLVLGYSIQASLYRIIIPQVIRNVLPVLFGQLEGLLKSTSLLAAIGVVELTRVGMNIVSRELNPLLIYCLIACIYLVMSAFLHAIMMYAERRYRYDRC